MLFTAIKSLAVCAGSVAILIVWTLAFCVLCPPDAEAAAISGAMTEHQFVALAATCAGLVWLVQITTAWRDHRASSAYMTELRKIVAARRNAVPRFWEDVQ